VVKVTGKERGDTHLWSEGIAGVEKDCRIRRAEFEKAELGKRYRSFHMFLEGVRTSRSTPPKVQKTFEKEPDFVPIAKVQNSGQGDDGTNSRTECTKN
jgi:hypothetical protein